MELVITLQIDNAAFEPSAYREVARILREYGQRLLATENLGASLRDVNGNTVGHAFVLDDHGRVTCYRGK
jgi:hypothetical protein